SLPVIGSDGGSDVGSNNDLSPARSPSTGDSGYVPYDAGPGSSIQTGASNRTTDDSLGFSQNMIIQDSNHDDLSHGDHTSYEWSQTLQREGGFPLTTPEPVENLGHISGQGLLWTDLDTLGDQLGRARILRTLVIGSAMVVTTIATIIYTLWTVWGGYLLTSVLSLMPGWRLLDPLPILESAKKPEESDDDKESLASMIDDNNSRLPAGG
ncbi:MAG: hypothetical protein OES79_02715, partial [Planctomycetota bacterium]|nr:hypothetical protein [Planctomycetota bacterium]